MTALDPTDDKGSRADVDSDRPAKSESVASSLDQLPDPCSSAELAVILGKSPKTVVDWCQERAYTHIPCFRLGNRWYHRLPELIRWLNGIKSGLIEFRRKPCISEERR